MTIKNSFVCCALVMAGVCPAAEIPFTVVPMGIGASIPTEDVVATIRRVNSRSGITRFVLHAPGHTVRLTGYYDAEGYRGVGRRVKAVQDGVKDLGIEVGFLMGPTMNVGINHPWQKMIRPDGAERPFTACPGDPAFRKAFAERCGACAAECKPFLYMMEDDYRYFFSGCSCPLHLERFSKLTGAAWTREALVAALAKPENTSLRIEWNRLQSGDLVTLAADAEKAIHAVSPKTRIGISAPGGFKEEDTAAIARALAGGVGRPLVRWWGTVYGYDVPLDQSRVLFSALWSKENVSDGIDCVYEADAAPNTAFYGSGARLGASCSSVLAGGFDGLWYWAASANDTVARDDPAPNLDAFERDAARWAAIQEAVKGGRTVGPSVAFNPNSRLVGVCGVAANGHGRGSGAAGMLLGRMGLPYTTRSGAVTAHTGYWTFEGVGDAEIEKILSGNVFLDGAAAEALTERGFAKLIGVAAEVRGGIDFTGEVVSSTGGLIGSSYHQNYGLDNAAVSRLKVCGAEVVSSYYSGKPANVIQPSVTRFVNAKGGRVVVLASNLGGCTATNVYNFRKRSLLIEAFEWLGGEGVFPIRTVKDVNVVVTANEDAEKSRLVVHAVNLSCDARTGLSFEVASAYRGATVELLDGAEWRRAASVWNDGRLEISCRMGVFDTIVLRLKQVKGD